MEVIIAKAGKPVARLIPITVSVKQTRLGLVRGKIKIAGDFNAPLADAALSGGSG
jgi:antitoxin (DNA-binding transcriptional repressor) of toxin-antitoxin stability system